jgi:phosphoribosylanthranilate isomerase
VRVKICGVTRLEDGRLAATLGAWAVGFVFWPGSPRFVDPSRARDIARQLPPAVTAVGVFVDQPAEYVTDVARYVGLGAVQLHGNESAEYARSIARPEMEAASTQREVPDVGAASTQREVSHVGAAFRRPEIIKAFSLEQVADASELGEWGEMTVLLDAVDTGRRGGTGKTIDWHAAARIARMRPVVLAGGLGPDNVAEAVRLVKPAAIDVSSGVERSPGLKDAALMEALFAAVADSQEVGS